MSNEPKWLKDFVDKVCEGIVHLEAEVPIGCHYHMHEGTWEISLFAATTEIIGGPSDGELIREPLVFNVHQVLRAFDVVNELTWQSGRFNVEDDLGTHLAVSGQYKDQMIWLRLLSTTPARFSPGRTLQHATGNVAECW